MPEIEAGSVDMVLCDLPYGTTQNKWDSVLPLELLWQQYRRLGKSGATVALCAGEPFTSALIMSSPKDFKYRWTWDKVNKINGHLNAKKAPMKVVEDVCVFLIGKGSATYHPQMVPGEPYKATSKGSKSSNYGSQTDGVTTICDGLRYPRDLISIKADERGTVGRIHPTQKPVVLMEYLIRTYTNADDLVLDNTMGSGTTGVACVNTGRRFIGFEKDPAYFDIARKRIAEAVKKQP